MEHPHAAKDIAGETWLTTISGKRLDFADPDPNAIDLNSIAHGLAMNSRWSGQANTQYSIAQHSVMCSTYVESDDPEVQLDALFHDGAEAFMLDLSTGLKNCIPQYKVIEDRMMWAIRKRFNLLANKHPLTSKVDVIMLATEAKQFNIDTTDWGLPYPALDVYFPPWPWLDAKERFIETFENINARRLDHG